jgi:hypothetical protein
VVTESEWKTCQKIEIETVLTICSIKNIVICHCPLLVVIGGLIISETDNREVVALGVNHNLMLNMMWFRGKQGLLLLHSYEKVVI